MIDLTKNEVTKNATAESPTLDMTTWDLKRDPFSKYQLLHERSVTGKKFPTTQVGGCYSIHMALDLANWNEESH